MGIQPHNPASKGPAEWFTGEVLVDRIVEPNDHSQLSVGLVTFSPQARSAWHHHEGGQTLYVTQGKGLVQSRGEALMEIVEGTIHVTPDGQEHWHGAQPNHAMTHLSITQGPATWGEHVTDSEYGQG